MPRRSVLSAAEGVALFALPDTEPEMTRRYEFSDRDLSVIGSRRGAANRLGFAVQLAYMRYPGVMLGVDEDPAPALLEMAAAQLHIPAAVWADYGERGETRREHLLELQSVFGYRLFTIEHPTGDASLAAINAQLVAIAQADGDVDDAKARENC